MNSPIDSIYWRDEILQILFWIRGEGLGELVSARDVIVFLQADEQLVQQQLEQMAHDGYVELIGGNPVRYRLTEWGIREGGRRFADEFAGLTGQAHGECSDPNCACKTEGPEACEGQKHRH